MFHTVSNYVLFRFVDDSSEIGATILYCRLGRAISHRARYKNCDVTFQVGIEKCLSTQ